MSYLPNGFFSRLITRILCDNIVKECLLELIELEYCLFDGSSAASSAIDAGEQAGLDPLIDFVCQEAEWRCWQTGIELKYMDYTLVRVKEIVQDPLQNVAFNEAASSTASSSSSSSSATTPSSSSSASSSSSSSSSSYLDGALLYRDAESEYKVKRADGKQHAFIECYASFRDYKIVKAASAAELAGGKKTKRPKVFDDAGRGRGGGGGGEDQDDHDALIKIICKRQMSIKIFALIIEIIDSLLEDWYPDLGTRFMQDSKGDYLVTRLAPCTNCVRAANRKRRRRRRRETLTVNVNTSSSMAAASSNSSLSPRLVKPMSPPPLASSSSSNQFFNRPSQHQQQPLSPTSRRQQQQQQQQQHLQAASMYDSSTWRIADVDGKFKLASVQADNVSLLLDEEEEAAMRMLLDDDDDYNDETLARNETSTATSAGLMAGASGGAACDVPEALANMEWTYCFMIDDICHSVLKNSRLVCPKHGEQVAALIAPDLAFNDIEDKYLITKQKLCIESLLGRGSFGSVYCGSLDFSNNNSNKTNPDETPPTESRRVQVAVKVLETMSNANDMAEVERNFRQINLIRSNKLRAKSGEAAAAAGVAGVDDEQKKEAFNKNWNYGKSIRLAAKAYVVARQEIAIISSLRHEHIVTMIGLSIQPLAIILELAPLGNFKDILGEYKKHMCKLSPLIVQRVCIQISSALVYLVTRTLT